ncbi:MAG TPA: hypothetical protein P5519_00795 [Spirochaetia bacterium]|nr:hypothetical protein [Spirochaetales bacterium]HRS64407.1 hypothetical protein [Spirochaetia bacterium]HOT59641.1 hypothetical protein [Spirochaetales bacterium]HPD79980.1 hypothetical protein [Spirochaetales bacterium]HQK34302.1 hypothetical protein [Spirochaetales bacterium]
MKKTAVLTALVLAVVVSVSAQGFGPGMGGQMYQGTFPADTNQQVIKIEGKLTLVQGHPAVVTKTDTYFIRLPAYLYGFISELKEGAQVKLEGYTQPVPYAQNTWFFLATKLTVAGKDYDLTQLYANRNAMQNRPMKKPGGRW